MKSCSVIRSSLIFLKTSLLQALLFALSSPLAAFKHGPGSLTRLQSLKTRQELKDLLPSSLTLLLAGSFSSLLCGLLHKATQNAASPRARDPRNRKERIPTQKPQSISDLTFEVADHPFDLILFIRIKSLKSILVTGREIKLPS